LIIRLLIIRLLIINYGLLSLPALSMFTLSLSITIVIGSRSVEALIIRIFETCA